MGSTKSPQSPITTTNSNLSLTTHWRVDHFSKLEYLEHKYVHFSKLPKLWTTVEPIFDVMLVPSGHVDHKNKHTQPHDYVRFIIEHRRCSFGSDEECFEVPEKCLTKEVHFRVSFLDSHGTRCNTQEARLPLFKDPNYLYDRDVEMNVAYSYLLDPNHDLLHDDALDILVEAQIIDRIKTDSKTTVYQKGEYRNNYLPTEQQAIDTERDVYYP